MVKSIRSTALNNTECKSTAKRFIIFESNYQVYQSLFILADRWIGSMILHPFNL